MHYHDRRELHLHHRRRLACRIAQQQQMGKIGGALAMLFPRTGIQHELDHDQQ